MMCGGKGMPMRAAYFLVQGAATLAWWIVIGLSPAARRWFAFGDDGESLLTFLAADVCFWIGGSLAAAWGEWSGAAWTSALRPVLCGALACSAWQEHEADLERRFGEPYRRYRAAVCCWIPRLTPYVADRVSPPSRRSTLRSSS